MLRINKNPFTSIETVTKSVTMLCVGMAEALPGQETEGKRPQEEQELSISEDIGGMPEGGGEGGSREKGQHVLRSGEEA